MRLDRWALVLIFVLLTGSTAFAETAITCHCFKDRSYDPQQPEKVADYLLATTQNSFFAEVFGIKKFEVVKSRMSGTSAEDLWLAYYLAGRGGIEPEALLNARALDGSWAVVVNKLDLPTQNLGEELRTALALPSRMKPPCIFSRPTPRRSGRFAAARRPPRKSCSASFSLASFSARQTISLPR